MPSTEWKMHKMVTLCTVHCSILHLHWHHISHLCLVRHRKTSGSEERSRSGHLFLCSFIACTVVQSKETLHPRSVHRAAAQGSCCFCTCNHGALTPDRCRYDTPPRMPPTRKTCTTMARMSKASSCVHEKRNAKFSKATAPSVSNLVLWKTGHLMMTSSS